MITFATIKIKNKRLMKKLAYILFIVFATVSVSSCSKDDADEQENNKCRFEAFWKSNGKPEIISTKAEYDGRLCRQIEYDCIVDTMQSFGPAKLGGGTPLIKLCTLFDEDEIIIFDATVDRPDALPTNYRIVFNNGDAMYFDTFIEPNIKNGNISFIRTKYQCVHLK